MAIDYSTSASFDPIRLGGAGIRLTIQPDALSVLATVTEPDLVDPASVGAALATAGVAYGIQVEAVAALCSGEKRQDVIARGDAAQPGEDARFEPLVACRHEGGAPKILADGRVDYFDLGYVTSVSVGDPLMRRIPPTRGIPGCNVRGETLPCRDGQDRPFRHVGLGTQLCPDDPDLLVAAEAGLPTIGPDHVRVDPVLWLPAVDVGTGHIQFAGTVVVAGDVTSGLQIEAGRDVIVAGTVEAAEIRAGGNVELRGGMVGQGQGRVTAGGSITARYLDNVAVSAGEDLYFEETLSHCQVTVCRDVIAVSTLGRGQVMGGRLQAGRQVRVRLLGAPAGTFTSLAVGVVDQAQIERAQSRVAACHQNLIEATQQIVKLRVDGRGGPALAAARADRERLQAELQIAEHYWAAIQPVPVQQLQIRADKGFFGGVEVRFGEVRRFLHEDMPAATLVQRGGQISLRI